MKPTNTNQLARAIAPYVATIVSLSLAVTLRVEHSCSGKPSGTANPSGTATYDYRLAAMSGSAGGSGRKPDDHEPKPGLALTFSDFGRCLGFINEATRHCNEKNREKRADRRGVNQH